MHRTKWVVAVAAASLIACKDLPGTPEGTVVMAVTTGDRISMEGVKLGKATAPTKTVTKRLEFDPGEGPPLAPAWEMASFDLAVVYGPRALEPPQHKAVALSVPQSITLKAVAPNGWLVTEASCSDKPMVGELSRAVGTDNYVDCMVNMKRAGGNTIFHYKIYGDGRVEPFADFDHQKLHVK